MLWTSSCAACTTAASQGRSFGTWRRQQTLFVVFSCDCLRRRWSKKARPCFSRRTVENLCGEEKKTTFLLITAWDRGPNSSAGRVRRTPPPFCASANQRSARLHGRQSPPPAGGTRSPVRFLRGVKPHFIFRPRHR